MLRGARLRLDMPEFSPDDTRENPSESAPRDFTDGGPMMGGRAPLADIQKSYWRLLELRPRFPGARTVLIRSDWREATPPSGPAARLFRNHLGSSQTVLDVGAGDRYWQDVLARLG